MSAPVLQKHKDTWSLSHTWLKILCSSLSSPGLPHSTHLNTDCRLSSLSQNCVCVLPCGPHHFDPITLWCIDKKHQQELVSNSATHDRTAIYCIVCSKQAALLYCNSFLWWSRTSFINRKLNSCSSCGLSSWSERKLSLDMSKISSIMQQNCHSHSVCWKYQINGRLGSC